MRMIESYRDLDAWREGMKLAEDCYYLTREFPREELYGMVSQIRRSAASVPANIAEGYGRKYRAEYIRFLYISQGSLKELETHLILSGRVELASKEKIKKIILKCEQVGKILGGLIRSLENKN